MNTCRKTLTPFVVIATIALAFLTLALAGAQIASAQGAVIYVDKDAPGPTHDGLSWVEASFDGHPRCVLLSRRRRFERSELVVFTTLASGISSALLEASRFV